MARIICWFYNFVLIWFDLTPNSTLSFLCKSIWFKFRKNFDLDSWVMPFSWVMLLSFICVICTFLTVSILLEIWFYSWLYSILFMTDSIPFMTDSIPFMTRHSIPLMTRFYSWPDSIHDSFLFMTRFYSWLNSINELNSIHDSNQ